MNTSIWGAGAVAALLVMAAPACADDDFPIIGNYTQNVKCKGDGTDPADAKVAITEKDITSNVGVCAILNKKRDGNAITAHVECKLAGGPLLGDVSFTIRPDKTLKFVDRDSNYNAILHKCPG
jgi:hypothetical protein